MIQLQRSIWTWKTLVCACLVLAVLLMITMSNVTTMVSESCFGFGGKANIYAQRDYNLRISAMKEFVNNSGAMPYLVQYEKLYLQPAEMVKVKADPNDPRTITTWWQAAAMVDWYMKAPVRYQCKNKKDMGNWNICQDAPYTIKPPCLVYSFGINWEFAFDDAMTKLGCEVHLFDPSMKEKDHKRANNSTFHNMGIGSYNTDAFVPRHDIYVKDSQTWKIRTVKAIMKELGHENRVIDVFKMDVETYEWTIIDNMIETDVFRYIRQFDVEYHLFHDYPLSQEYIHIYQVYTRLREMGFKEYLSNQHQSHVAKKENFRLQADVCYADLAEIIARNVVRHIGNISQTSTSWISHVAGLPETNFTVTRDPLTASFIFPAFSLFSTNRDDPGAVAAREPGNEHFERRAPHVEKQLNNSGCGNSRMRQSDLTPLFSTGLMDITNIMLIADSALTFAQNYPYKDNEEIWIPWVKVRRNHLTFISSLEIVISRRLYHSHVPKRNLGASVVLGFIGKSTTTFPVELYIPGSQEVVIKQTVQINGIDKMTRKSCPFPDWFRSTYEGQCSLKSGFRLNPFSRPQETYIYKHEVLWIETDENAHTNFTSYVKYATDGLHYAMREVSKDDNTDHSSNHQDVEFKTIPTTTSISDVFSVGKSISGTSDVSSEAASSWPGSCTDRKSSKRALKGMSKDILKQGVKMLRVCYINECLEGDVVDVHLWQEVGEEFTVRCSVEKGEQSLCQIVLEYFSPLAKL